MPSGYAWIVDTDHIPDPTFPEGSYCNAKGLCGPSDAPEAMLDRLRNHRTAGHKFRIHDDDGELYYSGRILFADCRDDVTFANLPEEAFGPLDDFAKPNAGATEIKYRNDGKWVTL